MKFSHAPIIINNVYTCISIEYIELGLGRERYANTLHYSRKKSHNFENPKSKRIA